jgi:WD40 repeat protein
MVFSPDGARIASAGADQAVKLWDAASGRELRTFKGYTVNSLAFSPDGTCLAALEVDGTVHVWDMARDYKLRMLKGPGDYGGGFPGAVLPLAPAVGFAFSPDGTRIASAQPDGVVMLRDAASGREIQRLKGHASLVASLAFSPDGTRIASTASDGTARVWDTASGHEIYRLHGERCVAFSPDGARIVSIMDDTVYLWDAATGMQTAAMKADTPQVSAIVFSRDGSRLAYVGSDGTVKRWSGLTPAVKAETESVALLKWLFSRPLPKADVIAAVGRDKILSEAARQKALELVDRFKEETDPQKYHAAAWPVIQHPYSNVFVCQFALAQMKSACQRAPDNATYRIALGIAQYRLGKFEKERYADALATLHNCDEAHPTTLAFLAMTQQLLGQKDEAQATLARLRELMKDARWSGDQQAQAFLREAEELIEGKPAQP